MRVVFGSLASFGLGLTVSTIPIAVATTPCGPIPVERPLLPVDHPEGVEDLAVYGVPCKVWLFGDGPDFEATFVCQENYLWYWEDEDAR